MMIPIGKGQSTYKYPQARSSNGVYLAFNLKLYGKAKISTAWDKVVGIASRKKEKCMVRTKRMLLLITTIRIWKREVTEEVRDKQDLGKIGNCERSWWFIDCFCLCGVKC